MLCCLFCLSGPAKQESIEERERRGILCCISRGDASLLVWSTNSVLCSSPNLCVSWWNWKAAAFFTALYPTSMSTHRSDSMSKTRLFSFASHLAFQLLLLPLYIMLSFWLRVALYQIYLLYCFASNLCVCADGILIYLLLAFGRQEAQKMKTARVRLRVTDPTALTPSAKPPVLHPPQKYYNTRNI